MRTIFIIVLLLLLAACGADAPQVTITPQVTVTLLPPTATAIPTPTLYPQFVTLQDQIAASGERFDLLPDGTIQETIPDGVKIVSGLSADKNGQMNLLVNGDEVALNPADVSFNDKNGVKVKGYQFDEKLASWLPAIDPNLIVDLGAGLVASSNDMTVFDTELKYASPEAMAKAKRAGDIFIWASTQAGNLSKGLDAGTTGNFVPFEKWMDQVRANNGMVEGVFAANAHSNPNQAKQGVAEVVKLPGIIDLNKFEIAFHEPGKTRQTPPFSDSVPMGGFWIKSSSGVGGIIKINMGMGLNKQMMFNEGTQQIYFANEDMTPEQIAQAYSEMMATFVMDMEGLANLSKNEFDAGVVLDGYVRKGDPTRIALYAEEIDILDLENLRPTFDTFLEAK